METPLHPTPMARPMMKGKLFIDVSNKPTFQVWAMWVGWLGRKLASRSKWPARFFCSLRLSSPDASSDSACIGSLVSQGRSSILPSFHLHYRRRSRSRMTVAINMAFATEGAAGGAHVLC